MTEGAKAPQRLRCEFLENPMGLTNHPHFSWWVSDVRPAEVQSAYEIHAATSAERLRDDSAELWVSGRVEGFENAHVPYQGLPVTSTQQVWWRVRTYDSDGEVSPWSIPASFEMGMLEDNAFLGEWVSSGQKGNRHAASAPSILRQDFELAEEVDSARLLLGLKGQAKICLNESQVCTLPSVWLDYSEQYPSYMMDVSPFLRVGLNSLTVVLAEGTFAGEWPTLGREIFGEAAQVKVNLQIESQSGRKVELMSGFDWKWRPSWISSLEWLHGETSDHRAKQAPPYSDNIPFSDWGRVVVHAGDGATPVATQPLAHSALATITPEAPPVRRLIRSEKGPKRLVSVVTFEQALVGRVQVLMSGKDVDEIVVRYLVGDTGCQSEDRFTSKGDGKAERLIAEFSEHNFTHVEVEYSVSSTLIDTVTAEITQLKSNPSLTFESDHTTLNKLVKAVGYTLGAVASSAPLRGVISAQRQPDLGYAALWAPLLAMAPDSFPILSKWLADAHSSLVQADARGSYSGGRVSSDLDLDECARLEGVAQIIWALYRYQNAEKLLATYYPALRAGALSYRHSHTDLLRQPRADLYGGGEGGALVATARFFGHLETTAKIAEVLGEHGDGQLISELAARVRLAFRQRFVTGDGHVVTDGISALLAALHWGLLDEDEETQAQSRLLERIQLAKYQVNLEPAVVGALLAEICRAGRLDMAYMVLLQTTPTSWMGRVLVGNKYVAAQQAPDPAQCAILDWIFKNIVGVQLPDDLDSEQNGFRHMRIAPKPPLGAQFQAGAPFNAVDTSFTTLYGEVSVAWLIGAQSFELKVTLPPSCTAEVELPDGVTQRVQSGSHSFFMDYAKGRDGVPILREVTSN
ncbi:MAG: alpha-L-rhamnosidase [Limisphaerales bacterium]